MQPALPHLLARLIQIPHQALAQHVAQLLEAQSSIRCARRHLERASRGPWSRKMRTSSAVASAASGGSTNTSSGCAIVNPPEPILPPARMLNPARGPLRAGTSAMSCDSLWVQFAMHPVTVTLNFLGRLANSGLAYVFAHDGHHRGQIAMMARQIGHPLSKSAGFGLWEWGTR